MTYTQVSVLEKLWQKVNQEIEEAHRVMLVLTGWVISLHALAKSKDMERLSQRTQRRFWGRMLGMLQAAARKSEKLSGALENVLSEMAERRATFANLMSQQDANARVYEALDEARWVLQLAGVESLILLFSAAEDSRLGDDPLGSLLAALQQAMDALGEASAERDQVVRAALETAMDQAKLLAEGGRMRAWSDPASGKGAMVLDDGQEPGAEDEREPAGSKRQKRKA